MVWILVAISAYLILAIANLLDKFLVGNVLKNSKAYAFVACLMGLVVFLASPWFLKWPGWPMLFFNLFNGAVFALALWSLYEALRRGEAARVLVLIGGVTPIFSLLFSSFFFKEQFSTNQWFGILFLLAGVVIIATLPLARSHISRIIAKLNIFSEPKNGGWFLALLSALAYSIYFISTKHAYSSQPFVSAFIWTRLGAALFVLLFLISASTRKDIRAAFHKTSPKNNKFLIIGNQILGASGFILQNYAIFLGSVVLVNALQGTQYAFLLVISAVLAALKPKLLKETFSWRVIIQKTAAVAIIAIGLYFITF